MFYVFQFLKEPIVKELNLESKENRLKHAQQDEAEAENEEQEKYSLFISVKEILNTSPEGRLKIKNRLKEEFKLTDKEELRVELNMNKLIHSVTNDPNILKISTIDEDKPKGSQDRKSESDILGVFVRINRQGITLSRSDLIFSMLKLNWK